MEVTRQQYQDEVKAYWKGRCDKLQAEIDRLTAEKREAENRAINKHDERLAEQESERIIDSCKKKWLGYIARKETKDE